MATLLLVDLLWRIPCLLLESVLRFAALVHRCLQAAALQRTARRKDGAITASRLIDELLLRVFDFLQESELRSAAQVCRSWRATAHDHPMFWRDISFFHSYSNFPSHDLREASLAGRVTFAQA